MSTPPFTIVAVPETAMTNWEREAMKAVAVNVYVLLLVCGGILGGIFYQGLPKMRGFPAQSCEIAHADNEAYHLSTIMFPCSQGNCEAWYYRPKQGNRNVIVMAHGLGAQKDFLLDKYAERFARGGYSVFLFDYASFGCSDGPGPRNEVQPFHHVADFKAAIRYIVKEALSLGVDARNIHLWGTSFAGGHVIVTAAQSEHKERIRSVVSQIPFLDSRSTLSEKTLLYLLQVGTLSAADLAASFLSLPRIYIPLKDDHGTVSALPGGADYSHLVPAFRRGGWQNQLTAAFSFFLTFYRPINYADQVDTPTLFVAAEKDKLCPLSAVQRTAARMKAATVEVRSGGHFDIYLQPLRDELIDLQMAFMASHSLP